MRIERIEIDGFGRFHDAHWALDDGLTVLLGANEAGKTTLLNGLRALLFGFEPTRDGRTWYPALAGGRRGGRLVLRTAQEERWTVERHGDRGGAGALAVRAPNGNQGGQETLDRLLHGADAGLFRNIFAFGLGELQTFDTLSTDGVRGRIYGAGAGLGGTSAVDLESRLRQAQDAIFKPRGQRPLNVLLTRIEGLQREIADLARQPEEHAAAHRERAELLERTATLRAELRSWRERLIRLANLRTAGPLAGELATLDADLAAGDPTLDALPRDAVVVLDRRLAAVAEARTALATIDEQIDAARVALSGLQLDEGLLAAADEIAALRDERAARSAADLRRRELEAAEMRHAAAVTEQLERVGGWDEARLISLDDSIASTEATRELERSMVQVRAANASVQERLRAAVDETKSDDGEDSSEADDQLDERSAVLRQLDELRIRRAAEEAAGRSSISRPAGLLAAVLLLVSALAIGWLLGALLVGAIAGVLGAALLVALALRGAREPGAGPGFAGERVQLLERIGLEADADDARVYRAAEELAAARARRQLARERAAAVDLRRSQLARHERDAARTAASVEEAERSWRDWLSAHAMPTDLSPEAARQLLAAAGGARRSVIERDEHRRSLEEAARDDEAFIERVDAFLASVGQTPGEDRDRRMALLAGAVDQLERSRADHRRASELQATIASLGGRREIAQEGVARAEAAVVEHLAAVGCPDPDALRRRETLAAERRVILARTRELRAGLAAIAGSADAVAALMAEAGAQDAASIEAGQAEAHDRVEELEAQERAALHRIGALEARIRELEAAEDLGQRRQELAGLEGQAAAIGHDWAVRAVALRLLEETRSRYERERQPDVVRAAVSHFERFTGGRYSRIVAPPGGSSVRVETEGGEGRTTEELSRGTAEQLYLALRFGLIEEFASHAEPLPVVMDDILVNFDSARAERAAMAIRDLAGRHQVLYFTCHPWTALLLDPDAARTLSLE
jgi:uncharacterized protein YhaN